MKKNKKILGVVLVLSLVALLLPATIFAAETGEVSCTVSGKLISLTVTDGSIAFGTLDLSSTKNSALYDVTNNANGMTTAQTQTITNTGSVAEDFNMKTSHAIGGTQWTLHATTPAADVFTYGYLVSDTAYDGTAAIGAFTKWTATGSYVADAGGGNVAVSGTKKLELEIGMPISTTDGVEKTITVTVQATEYTA